MPNPWRTLDDMPSIDGKRVLVRVDFNVPTDGHGKVTDDTRIRRALPTLTTLTERGARVILMSHRGRPKGVDQAFSMDLVARRLASLLSTSVGFVPEVVGGKATKVVDDLKPGGVLMLENLRFDPGEKKNDPEFAERLAGLGDFYVNDAFGSVHRAHASMVGVPRHLPSYAGRLLEAELTALTRLLETPVRPFWAVIGGAKVSDKVKLIAELLGRGDGLVIGGGMANTFLAAEGLSMGASKVEEEARDEARQLLEKARRAGIPVVLPRDLVVASRFAEDASHRIVHVEEGLKSDEMALDIGPGSTAQMLDALSRAKTILWNGPMGVFEWEAFSHGTIDMALGLAGLDGDVVVGGGDSVAAVRQAGVMNRLRHVSTGGGATLAFLEGAQMPGIEALQVRE